MLATQSQSTTTKSTPSEYLGLKLGQDFLDGARDFERNWLYTCQERGIWRLWWLIYCAVLGIDPYTGAYNTTQELQFVGSQAQYALFRVQLARRYIQQRKMMAQDQRPSFEGVATNNDVASLAQVNIATKAIEYMLTEAKLEQEASEALTSLCYFGGGGLMNSWDFEGGDYVDAQEPDLDLQGNPVKLPAFDDQGNPVMAPDPQTGQLVQQTQTPMHTVQKRSGAPRIRKLYPWQIAYDPYLEKDHPALTVKIPVNKYELAAQFPEKYDEIVKCTIDEELGDDALFAWGGRRTLSSDTIVLRMYFHKNCTAVPGGRFAGYVAGVGLWGVDEMVPCPLDKGIPVKLMISPGARYFGTGFGYPESSDLLSLQTVINEVISMCVTNIQKRGNANAYKRDDVQIDPHSWSQGGGLHDLPPGAEPPQWDEPPKMDSLSQFILEFALEQARLMLGSNSVTEGNPDANITSGSFAVLLVNVAQKYASDHQEAHDQALVETANDSLELARKNAKYGFWAQIAGIGEAPYVQLVANDQIGAIRRVKLVRRSPILSTFSGRAEVFDRTIALPKRDRADAMEMLLNGDTSSFAERDQASKLRIRKENEMMLQGILPVVASWDDHMLEGPEHRMEYDKVRTQDIPDDAPELPPPPLGQQDPAYEAWLATGGPNYRAWVQVCQTFEAHLTAHANALASTPAPMALVAGWAPPMVAPLGPPGMAAGAAGQDDQGQPGGNPRANSDAAAASGGGQRGPQTPKPPQAPKLPKGAAGTIASNL